MQLLLADSLDALPPGCDTLFPSDPLANAAWYRLVTAHALPGGSTPCFAVLIEEGQIRAVAPLVRQDDGLHLGSLTTPYSCDYRPLLLAPDAGPELVQAAGRRLGQFCRGWPTVRLDAIPTEWPHLGPFVDGLRQSGLAVQRFAHFGNWHEPVAGRSWDAYLADRPGALRETVRRKLKRCAQAARFELIRAPSQLERGIAAFEAVYRASWKESEPSPHFNAALMRAAAAQGMLRLGVLWVGETPAASQFWTVANGRATVLKLAHDETFRPLSPGTALTAMMMRGLLDDERVDLLDFGRGDDPYKAAWTTRRQQRIGLLLMTPWRAAGLAALGRVWGGRLRTAWSPHIGGGQPAHGRL